MAGKKTGKVENGDLPQEKPASKPEASVWNETDVKKGCCFKRTYNFIDYFKKKRMKEKFIFVISVVSLIMMSYGVLYEHWLLPYYYTVLTPFLMIIRFIMYFKSHMLNFMLDFCYFANILSYIYLWAVPYQAEVFSMVFSFANGPLPWATVIFRNSLVFHSADKMTSIYIHVLPMFLTFSIRWYGSSISYHWYKGFVNTFSERVDYMFLWLVSIPLVLYIFHTITLYIVLQLVCKPKEKYIDSFRYLSNLNNGWTAKVLSCLGPLHKGCMFNTMLILYGAISFLLIPVWYKYFIAHCVYMSVVLLVTVWNGAGYYMDVFGPRVIQL